MKNSFGFSLIEVLVTLTLTTIGLLGMVALQGRGFVYIQDASSRSIAHSLSNELVEILRSNREELLTGANKNTIFTGFKDDSIFFKNKGENFKAKPISSLANANCNTKFNDALGKRDCWLNTARQRLPAFVETFTPHFYICQSSTPGVCDKKGSVIEIQLAWQVSEGACMDVNAPNLSTCIMRTRIEL